MGQVGPPLDPLKSDKPSDKLEDRDFALFVDGNRVNAGRAIIDVGDDGISVTVMFSTSVGALDSPEVDPGEETAWAGWKVGDSCHLYQPLTDGKRLPSNGYAQIIGVVVPKRAGDVAYFKVKAITPLYDHVVDETICEGGEYAMVPTNWFRR